MHISEVKTAFKIADVEFIEGQTKLKFNYLSKLKDENGKELDRKILTMNVSRVYLIVVDGIIKKIGASGSKGGMKNTLQIYQDGGVKGRPSIRSYGVWYFLYHTILQGKKIEFYMIYQDNFEADVKGLFGKKKRVASLNPKLIEECCLEDYLEREGGTYPEWNLQEQGSDWPYEAKEAHANIMKKSANRNRKKNKG